MCIYGVLNKAHIHSVTQRVCSSNMIQGFHLHWYISQYHQLTPTSESIHDCVCVYVYLSTSSRPTGTATKKAWQRKNDTTWDVGDWWHLQGSDRLCSLPPSYPPNCLESFRWISTWRKELSLYTNHSSATQLTPGEAFRGLLFQKYRNSIPLLHPVICAHVDLYKYK